MSRNGAFCYCRKSGQNNCLLVAQHRIERYALNGQGVVGSLYDACIDYLSTNLPVESNTISTNDTHEKPECKLIKLNNPTSDNLLKMIDIEDDLRLSIILNMCQITPGTLMMNTYVVPTNRTIRLIDYYHIVQEECLSTDIQTVRHTLPNTDATHIITTVKKGIDFIIILELPENENSTEIDSILEQLRQYFIKSGADFLSANDQLKLNNLKTIIFTQSTYILELTKSNKNFSDLCQAIHTYIYRDRVSTALYYIMHPINCIYHEVDGKDRTFCQFDQTIKAKIEDKIFPLSNKLKTIEGLFYSNVPPQLQEYFEKCNEKIHEKLEQVRHMYKEIQQNLKSTVFKFRKGKLDVCLLDNQLNSNDITNLASQLESLYSTVVELQSNASFIEQMEYVDVAQYEDSSDDKESLKGKLFSLNQEKNNYYLCSSDELIKKHPDEYKKLSQQLVELCQNNPSLQPVFADFSFCSFKLDAMELFQPPIRSTTTLSEIKTNEINILLIGESGVGKSTFINAFVNYLAFHSLNDAESHEPIVLIPASFLITIGDQFEERIIHLGQPDSNENYNQVGESVTQHCRSYIFNIDKNTKLCIIDTPGVGDTRGMEQDDKNIEHILSYINNLSHLNAICFLLKPNTTRLNVLFRSCFTQLFNFLSSNAYKNILFCFTNTRATFYTPGNTAPLLKEMLNTLSNGNTCPSFVKENTFCFDNESFRYLAIIKTTNEMEFDENQKDDFNKSWTMSVNESIRFLEYIKTRPEYQMNKCHSIKHAEMMIVSLVLPILETLRNAVRNLTLADNQHMIKMEVQSVTQPSTLCTLDQRNVIQIGNIWIVEHSIFYKLNYRLVNSTDIRFQSDTEKMKERLLDCTVIMTQFLLYTVHVSQNPFLLWFEQMVQEEEYLYLQKKPNVFHINLYNNIVNIKTTYEKSIKNQTHIKLGTVYQCINEVLAYPSVAEQMKAINKSQIKMMKDQEYDVSHQYPNMCMSELLQHSSTKSQ